MKRRVVVTGMGTINPVGHNLEETWENIKNGVCGIDEIKSVDVTGFKLKLFLHPRLAAQTADFEGNDVFEAIDCTKDSDYVTMMRTSDLMVTDFSSVMVDFAYARKPVVYYQDPALPYWRYYNFDYENIGFGEVTKSIDELVELLCEYMENDCALKDFYRKRIDDWAAEGSLTLGQRTMNKTKSLLVSYSPRALKDDVVAELDKIAG